MNELPDLSRLSDQERDELIRVLWAQVRSLQEQLQEIKGRLAKNSNNSSKPPSSDGLNKPAPKSLRGKSGRRSGGQKGHIGKTLMQVEPDIVVEHRPAAAHCDVCARALQRMEVVQKRQVFDLPVLRAQITEHRVFQARCECGKEHRGEFPGEVNAPAQYGPRAMAAAVHLNQFHLLPAQRTAEVMEDFFGLPMSDATVLSAVNDAAQRLMPTVNAIGQALQKAPVAHADETGMRVNKTLHWMHVLATPTLTWLGRHTKRGKEAFDALGLLGGYVGTLIHDGWKSYQDLLCKHGLCNAHHLRELTYVVEQCGQHWASRMIRLLVAANNEVQAAGQPLNPQRQQRYRHCYEQILKRGEQRNPLQPSTGKRGRVKQSKTTNLLLRLRTHADEVWRFMADPGVPFSNNVAEQAIRMQKVKQKISGCFRSTSGADAFCTIRSYLATMHKQGANAFDCLTQIFQGNTPQPRWA